MSDAVDKASNAATVVGLADVATLGKIVPTPVSLVASGVNSGKLAYDTGELAMEGAINVGKGQMEQLKLACNAFKGDGTFTVDSKNSLLIPNVNDLKDMIWSQTNCSIDREVRQTYSDYTKCHDVAKEMGNDHTKVCPAPSR